MSKQQYENDTLKKECQIMKSIIDRYVTSNGYCRPCAGSGETSRGTPCVYCKGVGMVSLTALPSVYDPIETIGQLVDKCENFVAATKLPAPPAMHVMGLRDGFKEMRDDLKELYFRLGGEDVWINA